MNRFDKVFAMALAAAALFLCVMANSIAANAGADSNTASDMPASYFYEEGSV